MGFERTVAARFIRGIILRFFLPPSASPARNERIDLLLVKLTATYNQEIKRNDRWPPSIEFNPLFLSSSFDFLHLHIYLAFPSPPIPGSNERYFGKGGNQEGRTPRRVALRRIKMSSKNLPYHVDPFQLRAIRARKDL